MAAAATALDVADLLGVEFTPDEGARAERLLTLAEGSISAEVPGIQYDAVTNQTVTLTGTTDDTLYLPSRPLQHVSSVIVGTQTIAPLSYRWTRRGELVRKSLPIIYGQTDWALLGGGWGTPNLDVTVVYDAGPTGPDVTLVAAELVRNAWVNPANLEAETIGQRHAIFSKLVPAGMALSSEHKRILRAYKLGARSPRITMG